MYRLLANKIDSRANIRVASLTDIYTHTVTKNNELDRKWLQVNHAKNHS